MNAPDSYITYWYESSDGDVEEFEINASDAPPATLNIPTTNGLVESYSLIYEKHFDNVIYNEHSFDDSSPILDD
jgi:hypothetical protein